MCQVTLDAVEKELQIPEERKKLEVVKRNEMCLVTLDAVEKELQIPEEKKKLEIVKRNKGKEESTSEVVEVEPHVQEDSLEVKSIKDGKESPEAVERELQIQEEKIIKEVVKRKKRKEIRNKYIGETGVLWKDKLERLPPS